MVSALVMLIGSGRSYHAVVPHVSSESSADLMTWQVCWAPSPDIADVPVCKGVKPWLSAIIIIMYSWSPLFALNVHKAHVPGPHFQKAMWSQVNDSRDCTR